MGETGSARSPFAGRPRAAAVAALATLAAFAVAQPASAATFPMTSKVYGKRYCEMGVAFFQGSGMHVDIYNTFGLGDCPTAAWAAATTNDALGRYSTSFGAFAVAINGPRWWAFDQIGGELGATTVSFGAVPMRKAATLDFDTPGLPPFFTPFTVHRTSTWVYNKGTPMRILTAPDGKRYAMQAWTTQVDKTLKASNISNIKPLLDLKVRGKGWKFSVAKAAKTTKVVAPGTMTIVQDNLKNVYSLIS